MTKSNDSLAVFIDLSVVLTGFDRVDLFATGMVRTYYDELVGIVGGNICNELWSVSRRIFQSHRNDGRKLDAAVRREVLVDPKLGPIARNIIKMWYLANWEELPEDWRRHYGARAKDKDNDHVVSAEAYKQGLVWRAMGAHPMGAKQPGFGTWSLPPEAAGG